MDMKKYRGYSVLASICGGAVLGGILFNAWWGVSIGAFLGLFLSIHLSS